ncbi:Hypothetical protein R9X50_00687900 [Acrodontium crateriforme]|uniref:Uncharacterized protein n=1 Tax=Acrodontium crateriforme TaxID=150365 RepID=A0AAQ3MAG5_9PEZI|nr:Hypothetical protein R9X50_00687900 [Acrodontium crateriforme]
MSDAANDPSQLALNLTPDEKRLFGYLFTQADSDSLGVVTGERAVSFFERTKVNPSVLGEIWQIADTENRGLLTQPGFCMVLRLIGHYQAGTAPSAEMALRPGPLPKFEGLQMPAAPVIATSPTGAQFPPNTLQQQLSGQGPIRVPPLDPQKVQQYSGLFEKSGAQNGMLDGATAKSIFERAGLPNEALGKIWGLSDRTQRGALDQTEFIVAMHLLTSMKSRAMTALPNSLPQGLYDAAARRGAPPPPGSRQPGARQFTGGPLAGPARAQSPLARPQAYGTPPPQSAVASGSQWLVSAAEKAKYDQFFANIDPQGRGIINGDQAVRFFSDSGLSEDTLASIWDLADINGEGQLNRDEFAVAMYLIRQQRAPNAPPLPAFLPRALVPPSMRQVAQSTQSTAPTFENAVNTSTMSKSAADDLFGLDQPASPPRQLQQPVLQAQTTGQSATRDPFNSGPGSPASPQRFQPQPQQASTMFKPFMPTSSFGASLAQQNTGGSQNSSQGFNRSVQQPSGLQQASAMDDLLGDNETSVAESSKITNETTELANMSNQIGNLRSQMEQTQAKKGASQQDLVAANTQKKDLELRLQQFRAQYEQEVRIVKELDQQLAVSRESTKKLSQELAMLEGTYQDLQTQHGTIAQALQADQQENANLKQKISQINVEVMRLKPEIEKMKLDARQQKGMVSINKKQLSTNEGERDRLQSEKEDLVQEASKHEAPGSNDAHYGHEAAIGAAGVAGAAAIGAAGLQAFKHQSTDSRVSSPQLPTASSLASPAASNLSSTNPFFRQASTDGTAERAVNPPSRGPTPSAFDALFGPSASQTGSRTGTPPATSFSRPNAASSSAAGATGMTESVQSISSAGELTPSATPPLSDQAKDSPQVAEPPPPPESRQSMAPHLPLAREHLRSASPASSTGVVPPGSTAGESAPTETSRIASPAPPTAIPGAFPSDSVPAAAEYSAKDVNADGSASTAKKEDFDQAFAEFGEGESSADAPRERDDPFASSSSKSAAPNVGGFHSEFPPIKSLEPEDEEDSDSESESGFGGDNFTAASPPRDVSNTSKQVAEGNPSAFHAERATTAEKALASELPPITAQTSPPTYTESHQVSHGGDGNRSGSNQFPSEYSGLLPARDDPTEQAESATPTATGSAIAHEENLGPSTTDSSHDTTEAGPSAAHNASASNIDHSKNAFDDFDDFDDLSEAKEADKSVADLDFGFGHQAAEDFNPAFDSPAASMTNTMASAQQTPIPVSRSLQLTDTSNGFNGFPPNVSTTSAFGSAGSIQATPQSSHDDWDAIFSGLENSKAPDTTFNGGGDPWGSFGGSAARTNDGEDKITAAPAATVPPETLAPAKAAADGGRALTPGTEHDDPILKRLTTMGYPRADALNALEMCDYDINRAVDHLTSGN